MRIIIIGAGEVGRYLAGILAEERHDVYVIEQNEKLARELNDKLDAQVLCGTGISRSVLERAGIGRADLLLAVTEADEVNLVAAMTAEKLHPECRTVARVRDRRFLYGHDALRAEEYGVDFLLGPEEAVANQVMSLLSYVGPGQITEIADGRIALLELPVRPGCALARGTIGEISGKLPPHSLVVAALGDTGLRLAAEEDRLREHDRVHVLCAPGEINDVLALAGAEPVHVKSVLIIGGGQVGYQVAASLRGLRFDVTVIERKRERAEQIATSLDHAVVLEGDGTDPAALAERMEDGYDAVVVLVDHDSDSVLTGILAKQHGAKKVIVRVDNLEYGPLARKLGIDALISPRRAVADAILRFVRRSRIMSTTMLGNHDGELIDFRVDARSKPAVLDVPVQRLAVPEHCLIGVVTRAGEIIVPKAQHDVRLQPGDHVFVVALPDAVPELDRLFG